MTTQYLSLSIDRLVDVDTTTDPPGLNDVLKFQGPNWVPGEAGDVDEFTFSIDNFDGTETDPTQLIGVGTWILSGAMSFTATYSNEPVGMTALVTMTGTATGWSTLAMVPTVGPEPTVANTSYPAAPGDTVTFTLTQSADGSSAVDTVTFINTLRFGTNTDGQGALSDANAEALSEVAGPSENLQQTITNLATAASTHVHIAYPARLDTITQVQMDDGNGFVTASFAAGATTMIPDVQTVNLASVANSASFAEAFEAITSRLSDLTDGARDFKTLTSSQARNYIRGGGNTESVPGDYDEADIETGLTDAFIESTDTDHTQLWPTVTLLASEHYVIAIPSRLGTPTFKDNDTGFEASFQAPATLQITNEAGFEEEYNIFVSTNPLGPGNFNLLTE